VRLEKVMSGVHLSGFLSKPPIRVASLQEGGSKDQDHWQTVLGQVSLVNMFLSCIPALSRTA